MDWWIGSKENMCGQIEVASETIAANNTFCVPRLGQGTSFGVTSLRGHYWVTSIPGHSGSFRVIRGHSGSFRVIRGWMTMHLRKGDLRDLSQAINSVIVNGNLIWVLLHGNMGSGQ